MTPSYEELDALIFGVIAERYRALGKVASGTSNYHERKILYERTVMANHDAAVANWLAAASRHNLIFNVDAGIGTLAALLACQGRTVHAIERDEKLIATMGVVRDALNLPGGRLHLARAMPGRIETPALGVFAGFPLTNMTESDVFSAYRPIAEADVRARYQGTAAFDAVAIELGTFLVHWYGGAETAAPNPGPIRQAIVGELREVGFSNPVEFATAPGRYWVYMKRQ